MPTAPRGRARRPARGRAIEIDEIDEVAEAPDVDRTLNALVRAAVRSIPGADAAGVTITLGGRVGSRAPTTAAVRTLDRLQGDWYGGPCITAADHPPRAGFVLADDLDGLDAARWPGFARYALDAGFHSILSIGLGSARGRAGALNLYAVHPNVFDAPAREVAGVFATRAAALVHGGVDPGAATDTDRARPAPTARDLVAQGVGILVGRFGVEVEAALDALVRASDDTGLGMVEIARRLAVAARHREAALPFGLGNGHGG